MFSPFERLVAFRYLRARRQEGFISVIAGFSLLGIALGVATLIVVMAVMKGFHDQLLDRILGLNGHMSVYQVGERISDYDPLAQRLREIDGVITAAPEVEGQVMATSSRAAGRRACSRVQARRFGGKEDRRRQHRARQSGKLHRQGCDHRRPAGPTAGAGGWRQHHPDCAANDGNRLRQPATAGEFPDCRHLRDRHV